MFNWILSLDFLNLTHLYKTRCCASKFLPVILKSNWFWFLFQVDTIKSLTKFATVKIRVAPVYFTFWEFKNNFDDEQKKFGKLQRTAKDVFPPPDEQAVSSSTDEALWNTFVPHPQILKWGYQHSSWKHPCLLFTIQISERSWCFMI